MFDLDGATIKFQADIYDPVWIDSAYGYAISKVMKQKVRRNLEIPLNTPVLVRNHFKTHKHMARFLRGYVVIEQAEESAYMVQNI